MSDTSWRAVGAWRDALRELEPGLYMPHLSPEGARIAWRASLDALDDAALAAAAAVPGTPYARPAVVCAGTVATAALEWVAVLAGRGGEVVLKHPRLQPDIAPLLGEVAARVGLPLRVSGERAAVSGADLIVAMGRDDTVRAVRLANPRSRVLTLGHRFSVAWVTSARSVAWDLLALDLAIHDGRGCMSPTVVFTPLPLRQATELLAVAMADRERRMPRGRLAPAEAAAIRSRNALAQVVGVVRVGRGWAIQGLPGQRFRPVGLPRSPMVVCVPHALAAARLLRPWASSLSTVGTDDPDVASVWYRTGASRVCPLGAMQRPPLARVHDGHDLLRVTIRGSA